MPIRSSVRHFYRKEWHKLSLALRTERAHNQCECAGLCGKHVGRCGAHHGQPNPRTGGKTVLTVAHLRQDPRDHDPAHLLVMCQSCHLSYDRSPAQRWVRWRVFLEIEGQTSLLDLLSPTRKNSKAPLGAPRNMMLRGHASPFPPLVRSLSSVCGDTACPRPFLGGGPWPNR